MSVTLPRAYDNSGRRLGAVRHVMIAKVHDHVVGQDRG
jgi:hypothetical protein